MSVVPATIDELVGYSTQLLAVAVEALESTPAGCPARRLVAPSTPAIDCELVAVVVDTITTEPIQPNTPPTAVGHQFLTGYLVMAVMTITWARCTAQPVGRRLPTAAEISAKATELNRDVWAVWNTIATRAAAGSLFQGACSPLYIEDPVPLEEAGGFAGWNLTIRARINGYSGA